nr:hypothetical protein BaRGS_024929 [Batillaria attramentaria]
MGKLQGQTRYQQKPSKQIQTAVNMLHSLFSKIWETEEVPAQWKEGIVIKLPKKGTSGTAATTEGSCSCQCQARKLRGEDRNPPGMPVVPVCLLLIDWIMKTTTAGRKNGIQWTLWTQLDDLDFADDLALLSHSHGQMQDKTTCLEATSAGTGLKINRRKIELMKISTTANTPVTVGGEPIMEVESFVYLGSVVDGQGGTDRDVTARIGKARAAMVMLKNVRASKVVSIRTKLRIFNSNGKSVLLDGCETWSTTKTMQQKIRNEELCERAGQEPVAKQILRRKRQHPAPRAKP